MPAVAVYLIIRGLASYAAATAFTLGLVYQIQTVGLGPLQLVLVGTALEVSAFLAQVPTGVIADLYSRRLSVIVGYLLIGAGLLLVGLVPAFVAVLVGNVVWGVGATCVDGAEEAWVADEVGEERVGKVFTRGSQVGQAATVLGIGSSAALASVALNLPIVVGACAWLVLGVVLVLIMPERHFHPVRPERRETVASMRRQVVEGTRAVRHRPVVLCLVGATLFVGLGSEGWDRLGQAHFLADFTFPAFGTPVLWFAGMSAAAMLCSIAVTEVVRRRLDVQRPRRVGRLLVGFQFAMVVGILLFAAAGEFWLAVAASLAVQLFRAVCHPLFATWMAAQTETRTRATVFSLNGQVDAAGQILGGPPVGLIGERASIRAALLATGALMLPAVALLAGALRRHGPPRS